MLQFVDRPPFDGALALHGAGGAHSSHGLDAAGPACRPAGTTSKQFAAVSVGWDRGPAGLWLRAFASARCLQYLAPLAPRLPSGPIAPEAISRACGCKTYASTPSWADMEVCRLE